MKTQEGGRQRWLNRWLTAVGLVGMVSLTGCCGVRPIEPARPELMYYCHSIPKEARDHVHVVFVHGADPCDLANIAGIRDYLADLGFCQIHLAQTYHLFDAIADVKKVHVDDPAARFVLVGFSLGANIVATITRCVKEDGIEIDLLMYCGGNSLMNKARDQPDNAKRIVNVLATGCFFNGAQMDRAENISEPDVFHFGTPSHPRTLAILVGHLTTLAATCPFTTVKKPVLEPLDPEPTPQPVSLPETVTVAARDEWDFLKPSEKLNLLKPDPNQPPPLMERKGPWGGKTLASILGGLGGNPGDAGDGDRNAGTPR